MKPTRREHIVSSRLLSNFTDDNGVLWVYTKDKPVRPSKPESECWERDFFEFELRGRKTNNRYENWLAQIEGEAWPVLQLLIDRRRLSSGQAQSWAAFVASLFGRTRKVRAQISEAMINKLRDQTEDPKFLRDLQHWLLQRGELHYAEDLKKKVAEFRTARETPSFYHVWALPNRVRVLLGPLLERTWNTLEAPAGKSFLISDCPVITVERQGGQFLPGAGFAKKNTVVLLPLDSTHLFVASPPDFGWKQGKAYPAVVDMINRLFVQFAHRNVYTNAESDGIRTLVDSEIDTLVFGKNVFLPASSSAPTHTAQLGVE